MAEDLKINVFIADEKYAILIPRNENQSDEEEIIRRSAKRVDDAVRGDRAIPAGYQQSQFPGDGSPEAGSKFKQEYRFPKS